MRRALLLASTVGSTWLGWFIGTYHLASRSAVVDRARTDASESGAYEKPEKDEESVDVHEVLAQINAEFDGDQQHVERAARLFEVLQDLKAEEFVSAVANLSSENRWISAEAARLLVGYWAERDLPGARDWVLRLPGKDARNFCDPVFETWSRSDLPEMFAWLENHTVELPSKGHRESAAFTVAKTAWKLDLERGMRLTRLLDPAGGYLWNLYNQWAVHDAKAASARVLQETDEKIRENVIFGVTTAWAPRDPLKAKAWAEAIPDPLLAQQTVTQIGSVLGWRDPRAGTDYLLQIPQTNETREALKGTVGTWLERDLDAALTWAATAPDPPLGDWIVSGAVANLPENQRAKAERRWRELRSTVLPRSRDR